MAQSKGSVNNGRPSKEVLRERETSRERIQKADPIGFLISIMQGKGFKRVDAAGGTRKVIYPTVEQSISAANTLAKKIAPDLKAVDIKAGDGEGLTFVFQSNVPLPNQGGQTIEGQAAVDTMKQIASGIADQIEDAVLADDGDED